LKALSILDINSFHFGFGSSLVFCSVVLSLLDIDSFCFSFVIGFGFGYWLMLFLKIIFSLDISSFYCRFFFGFFVNLEFGLEFGFLLVHSSKQNVTVVHDNFIIFIIGCQSYFCSLMIKNFSSGIKLK
jgi:hypothetical protein